MVTVTPTTDTVPQMEDHMIQCMYGGSPTPSITWALNGETLTGGENRVTIETPAGGTTSTLTVAMVTSENSGDYTCTASNGAGSSMASSSLTVQGMC